MVSLTRPKRPSVLFISVDGVRPDLVFGEAFSHVKIPNIRKILKNAAFSKGVTGIEPTLTYPSHCTLTNSLHPTNHGTVGNTFFDPMKRYNDAWCFFAPEKPSIWTQASEVGMVTASISWPCTVGAPIAFNIVEYWRFHDKLDTRLQDLVGTPGLMSEVVRNLGLEYYPGNEWDRKSDEHRRDAGLFILREKLAPFVKEGKPFFMTQYFAAYDEVAHHHDWNSAESLETLEDIDSHVGQIVEAARDIAGEDLVICLVSDHGFVSVDDIININSRFVDEGWIKTDSCNKIESWDVYAHDGHGTTSINIRDKSDNALYALVHSMCSTLLSQPGFASMLDREDLKSINGYSADIVLEAQPGFRFSSSLSGPLYTKPLEGVRGYHATHGYRPSLKETNAIAMFSGANIDPQELQNVNLVDIACTLADVIGSPFKEHNGTVLPVRTTMSMVEE